MVTIQELQKLREELIQEIDTKIGQLIEQVTDNAKNPVQTSTTILQNYEVIYPLNTALGIFKGKRPIAVFLSDGTRIESPTWKSVAGEILKDCCKDPEKQQALMNLRGKILGRNRVLLGSETGKMRSPLKIDNALYLETHYDTETLLRILTTRILDVVDYDYSRIKISVKAE